MGGGGGGRSRPNFCSNSRKQIGSGFCRSRWRSCEYMNIYVHKATVSIDRRAGFVCLLCFLGGISIFTTQNMGSNA